MEAGGRLIGGVWGGGAPTGIESSYVLCQRRASTIGAGACVIFAMRLDSEVASAAASSILKQVLPRLVAKPGCKEIGVRQISLTDRFLLHK